MTKVSVIIPVYNKGKYVAEAVESALGQTYADTEIICIDDCSTDNSYEVLKGLADKYKHIVLLKNEENKGVIYSRNTAIEAATGEYILPLDADDIIEPTYVEKAAKVLDSRPDIGIVYCEACLIGTKNGKWDLPQFDKEKILFGNMIFCSALFRKKDFYKAGMYKENMEDCWEDYDLWLSFIENNLIAYQIPEILFYYRKSEANARSNVIDTDAHSGYKKIISNHVNLYLNNEKFISKFLGRDKNKPNFKGICNKYDLYIPLGATCFCTSVLRQAGLQFYSYAFDWLYGASFIDRIKIIVNNFSNWLDKDDLEYIGNRTNPQPCDIYRNNKTGIVFNHDFKISAPLEDTYANVKEKYDRRIKRLFKQISVSKKILFVYIEPPHVISDYNTSRIIEGQNLLQKKFPRTEISILYVYKIGGIEFQNRKIKKLSDNITTIGFDYDAYNSEYPYIANEDLLKELFINCSISLTNLQPSNKIKVFYKQYILNAILKNIFSITKDKILRRKTVRIFGIKIKTRLRDI